MAVDHLFSACPGGKHGNWMKSEEALGSWTGAELSSAILVNKTGNDFSKCAEWAQGVRSWDGMK